MEIFEFERDWVGFNLQHNLTNFNSSKLSFQHHFSTFNFLFNLNNFNNKKKHFFIHLNSHPDFSRFTFARVSPHTANPTVQLLVFLWNEFQVVCGFLLIKRSSCVDKQPKCDFCVSKLDLVNVRRSFRVFVWRRKEQRLVGIQLELVRRENTPRLDFPPISVSEPNAVQTTTLQTECWVAVRTETDSKTPEILEIVLSFSPSECPTRRFDVCHLIHLTQILFFNFSNNKIFVSCVKF